MTAHYYELVFLETSDLHYNILPYDYYNDTKVDHYGLAKLASLINDYRCQYNNVFLVDNGDLLQGCSFSEVMVNVFPPEPTEIHPIYKVMNFLNYDVANIGNHDFDYGLEFVKKVTSQAKFPYTCANIYLFDDKKDGNRGERLFPPFKIIEREIDNSFSVKIGFIGVAPPQIPLWDKHVLNSAIVTQDMLEAVEEQTAYLKSINVDIVVVLAHSGILPVKYMKGSENIVAEITKVPGVDIVFSGHTHNVFPGGKIFDHLEHLGINNKLGKINDKPVVMPGAWGSHLGVIKLKIEKSLKANIPCKILESSAEIKCVKNIQIAPEIEKLIEKENNSVLKYTKSVVGETANHLHSWFSTLEPSLASQFVQEISFKFVKKQLEGTNYENFPILTAFAPLNTGTHGSPYINIPVGPLAIKDVSNLYPFDNHLKAVLVTGKQIKSWLENSAQVFIKIDTDSTEEILLLNPFFPSFNFDCIFGVHYKIDISETIGNRIKNLTYQNKDLNPEQQFIVVTNNYRIAGSSSLIEFDKLPIVIDSKYVYRNILIDHIKQHKVVNLTYEKNWQIIASKEIIPKLIYESSIDSISIHPSFLSILSTDQHTHKVKYQIKLSN